jgi:hypothetical protein
LSDFVLKKSSRELNDLEFGSSVKEMEGGQRVEASRQLGDFQKYLANAKETRPCKRSELKQYCEVILTYLGSHTVEMFWLSSFNESFSSRDIGEWSVETSSFRDISNHVCSNLDALLCLRCCEMESWVNLKDNSRSEVDY